MTKSLSLDDLMDRSLMHYAAHLNSNGDTKPMSSPRGKRCERDDDLM
jgi:hypothetical protein